MRALLAMLGLEIHHHRCTFSRPHRGAHQAARHLPQPLRADRELMKPGPAIWAQAEVGERNRLHCSTIALAIWRAHARVLARGRAPLAWKSPGARQQLAPAEGSSPPPLRPPRPEERLVHRTAQLGKAGDAQHGQQR